MGSSVPDMKLFWGKGRACRRICTKSNWSQTKTSACKASTLLCDLSYGETL